MSEWITDRNPTYNDAKLGYRHYVWVTGEDGIVLQMCYEIVGDRPWMPITPPEPYVKPKRWIVVWSELFDSWQVRDCKSGAAILLRDDRMDVGLMKRTDEHREAAERIAAIYEEVMP